MTGKLPSFFNETIEGMLNLCLTVYIFSFLQLEITCKASGVPIPELSLTLFYEYGPDLAKSPRYKVSKKLPLKCLIHKMGTNQSCNG